MMSFVIYACCTAIVAGFGVYGVLLQRLSLPETVLYCAARIVIVIGCGLYASILYRRFRDTGATWYRALAVIVILLGSVYSMVETFSGRAATMLNSYQQQTADLTEAQAKLTSASTLDATARANTAASQRFADSTRRGSIWGQVNSANSAARDARDAAALASAAAQQQRDAGVTEAQILGMVSPWGPLPTALAMTAWLAVLVELLLLLSAGGAADYIHSRRYPQPLPDAADNVVPLPSPAKRHRRQSGRIHVTDDTPSTPIVPAAYPDRTPAVPADPHRVDAPSTPQVHPEHAPGTPTVPASDQPTDAEYAQIASAVRGGLDHGVRTLRTVYKLGSDKARAVQARMAADGIITPRLSASGKVLGYSRAGGTTA